MSLVIREMLETDWDAVKNIYLEGIATGNATFQKSAPTWEVWNKEHLLTNRFVVENEKTIIGWAMLGSVSSRCVYTEVAEVSVYVASEARGKQVGYRILSKLISASEKNGIWTLEAGIFPENTASLMLHKKCGFREVGYREKLGKLDGKWRNVILLERRSQIIE
ncbi:MAG: GNAT family N-acetyltransferase [Gammaproteobacteria bacterium]